MRGEWDVVVAGGGPVGLAFAGSLAGNGLAVAVVEPQPEAVLAEPPDDGREIALADRSVRMLRALGAWERIPETATAPLARMQVLNGPSTYALQFGADRADGAPMAWFASNGAIRRALFAAVRERDAAAVLAGRRVVDARAEGARVRVMLDDGTVLRTRLLVAADTRRSALRARMGIGAAMHDYRQRMLVCPVEHEELHGAVATAWFEYGRTLVTLPLRGERSSVVMTLPPEDADHLLALDDRAFGAEVTRRYRGRLGRMRPTGRRHAVPVETAYARRFAGTRFALLGDAAVGMHPTTAHGMNFGLSGQDALAREVRAAAAAGGDPGDNAALLRFEAAHRADTRTFFTGAEAIMRLYAGGEALPARLLRDAALRIGNLPPLRSVLGTRMREPTER